MYIKHVMYYIIREEEEGGGGGPFGPPIVHETFSFSRRAIKRHIPILFCFFFIVIMYIYIYTADIWPLIFFLTSTHISLNTLF